MENKANILFLAVINNGDTYKARCHAAAKFVQGNHDHEGFRKEIGQIIRKEATEYRRKFKVSFSPEEKRQVIGEVMEYMIEHHFETLLTNQDKTKNVEVSIKRWRDKTYGNSYFSLTYIIRLNDGKYSRIYSPMEYGSGSHPEWVAWKFLQENGFIPDTGKYENGMKKGSPSVSPITFIDLGYMLKKYL